MGEFCNSKLCVELGPLSFGLDWHAVPPTVLIASAEHLSTLQEREDLGEVVAFSDAEALRALDLITRQRPEVVALERLFAATSRGAALINRIKADPSLSACEIRIVSHDSDTSFTRVPRRTGDTVMGVTVPSTTPAVAIAEASSPAAAPLDQRGTRRAPRFKMAGTVDVQIDGKPATLIDLSVVGAQVISPTILKPNQRIRFMLPNGSRPMRVSGAVAWASFDISKGGPRYRAGVEFLDADRTILTKFIDANKQ